jgi:hypothetical protein
VDEDTAFTLQRRYLLPTDDPQLTSSDDGECGLTGESPVIPRYQDTPKAEREEYTFAKHVVDSVFPSWKQKRRFFSLTGKKKRHQPFPLGNRGIRWSPGIMLDLGWPKSTVQELAAQHHMLCELWHEEDMHAVWDTSPPIRDVLPVDEVEGWKDTPWWPEPPDPEWPQEGPLESFDERSLRTPTDSLSTFRIVAPMPDPEDPTFDGNSYPWSDDSRDFVYSAQGIATLVGSLHRRREEYPDPGNDSNRVSSSSEEDSGSASHSSSASSTSEGDSESANHATQKGRHGGRTPVLMHE